MKHSDEQNKNKQKISIDEHKQIKKKLKIHFYILNTGC